MHVKSGSLCTKNVFKQIWRKVSIKYWPWQNHGFYSQVKRDSYSIIVCIMINITNIFFLLFLRLHFTLLQKLGIFSAKTFFDWEKKWYFKNTIYNTQHFKQVTIFKVSIRLSKCRAMFFDELKRVICIFLMKNSFFYQS